MRYFLVIIIPPSFYDYYEVERQFFYSLIRDITVKISLLLESYSLFIWTHFFETITVISWRSVKSMFAPQTEDSVFSVSEFLEVCPVFGSICRGLRFPDFFRRLIYRDNSYSHSSSDFLFAGFPYCIRQRIFYVVVYAFYFSQQDEMFHKMVFSEYPDFPHCNPFFWKPWIWFLFISCIRESFILNIFFTRNFWICS